MYNTIEDAIHFAFIAHKNQKRKREDIEAIFHPISVGMMLSSCGCNESTVISGILHDVIEDTEYSYDDISKKFGKDIADTVLLISEDISITDWRSRKESFVDKISKSESDIALIECADKLHNLLSDYGLYQEIGKDIFKTSSTTFDNLSWFHNKILSIAKEKVDNTNDLLRRYEEMVKYYFDE
jgi:(p)ppGpp synthase/HD superfamily hydrolase